MISKMTKGAGARGIFDYLYRKVYSGDAEVLETNMLGDNPRSLAKEIGTVRCLKSDISKPMYHVSLNLPLEETVSNEIFISIAHDYLESMGLSNNQYMIHRHHDREHQHIHLVVNRISLDGEVVSDKFDFIRSTNTIRMLEKKYKLEVLVPKDKSVSLPMNKGLIEKFNRTNELPAKKILQVILQKNLPNCTSWSDLQNAMINHGAKMIIHETNAGKPFGVSFEYEGIAFKGRSLSKSFSFNSLTKQIQENYERKNGRRSKSIHSATTEQEEYIFHANRHRGDEKQNLKGSEGIEREKSEFNIGNPEISSERGFSEHSSPNRRKSQERKYEEFNSVHRGDSYNEVVNSNRTRKDEKGESISDDFKSNNSYVNSDNSINTIVQVEKETQNVNYELGM